MISVEGKNIPTQTQKLDSKDAAAGIQPKIIPAIFYVVTRYTETGTVYLKVVNTSGEAQRVKIDVKGAAKLMSNGLVVTLKANNPEETNSITEPEKVIPVTSKLNGISKSSNHSFLAYSITVLQVETTK